nr:hypothetical protein [uncultured Gammaproteobacteria bacterium]
MWDAEHKLYLYPQQPFYRPSHQILEQLLIKLQFIGKLSSVDSLKLSSKQVTTRYEVGDKFLSQLTFMGCSPDIELEPQENKPYCYIEIEQIETPRLISGKNLKPAKCPHCKSPITELSCENCQKVIAPEKLNWRKTAFYASSWISIGNIYELEAIPNDNLLNALEENTGIKWKAAYIRHI